MSKSLFERLLAQLPQTQCGECGYQGCEPYARAMAEKGEACNLCPPGGERVWKELTALVKKPESVPPAVYAAHRVRIDQDICIGCYKCIRVCPVDAIVGAPKRLHQINLAACTGCDICLAVCPVDCIHPVFMPDADGYYQKPQLLYEKRRQAFIHHQQQHHQQQPRQQHQPQLKTHSKATIDDPGVAISDDKEIIRKRLNQALKRARQAKNKTAYDRLTIQLQQLSE